MGEIPHSEKMFHLPIEVSVYVPSTQDVNKVVSKSEMKLRVDEVKKYLATLFGGFSSSSVEGGFLASDGKVVKENVERVVSFAPKGEFEKKKEALVQKASEWATKWGQEAIGLEHEGDLYYVPQKFENGGTIAIREAKEMANSQALEIKHHASELANALKGNPTIEAWVIAKLERASNDLADVTHYLEGRVQMSGKKMADGGGIQTFKQKQLAELKIWKKSKLEDLKSVSKNIGITSNNNSYLSSLERLDKLVDACEKVIKSGILKDGKYFYIKEFIVDSYRGNLQTQASLRFDKFLITEDKNFEKDWAEQKQKFPYADMNSFIAQKVGELTKKILGYSISSSISYSIASSSIGGTFADGGEIYGDSYSEESFNLMQKHLEQALKKHNLKYYIENPNAKKVEYVVQGIDIYTSISIYRNYDNYFGKFYLYMYSEKLNPRTQTRTIKEKEVLDDLLKQIAQISKVMTPEQIAYKKQIDDLKNKLEDALYMYGDSDWEQKEAMKTSKFKNLERKLQLLETEYSKKYADGGSIYDEDFNGSGQLSLKVDNEAVAKLDYDYDLESAFSEDLNGYKNEFYISNVETKKEFRGKGYAKRLIRQAIEKAKRLGVELISLRRDSGMGCNYGSEYDNYLKKIYESIGFVEKNNDCVMILETKKYADGGSIEPNSKEVQFIKYRDEEIMYDPIFQEFFVNDVMFKTLQEARAFIDKGAPMSDEIKDAYRRGLFKKGGNMKFERPTYKSNYVASQAQQAQAQADANLIADENWNMDYKNDPLLKKKKEAQELGIRAGLAYATKGQSEIVRFQNQAKEQAKQQQATKEQAPEMQETTSTENSAFPEHEVQPELAKMIENNPQMVQMLSGLGGLKGV